MYQPSTPFEDIPAIGTIDQVKGLSEPGTSLIVRVNGIPGLHSVHDVTFNNLRTLCDIGKSPWFNGHTLWVHCKDVEVIERLKQR